ncbi:Band 4.1-like protein 2 [Takifugu flavidus]|uniref:Band 4.1-like protein 2 n=1 Tax=Takifugu flavidus TaxID=433684 RepID=A0A5C6NUC1_9TELE|nr:Band 4.1-like protein 2 [Takifugu flavidus]
MGAGLYGAFKFTTSDVITTVTPEKMMEEKRAEQEEEVLLLEMVQTKPVEDKEDEEQVEVEVEEQVEVEDTKDLTVSQQSLQRHDTKTELTDTVVDGDMTATESDQDEDLKTQDTVGSPEEEQQPQSSMSVLRRSFFEGGAKQGGAETEWEKRLASSPLRHLDSPMIEPLDPEEVRSHLSPTNGELATGTSLSSSCCCPPEMQPIGGRLNTVSLLGPTGAPYWGPTCVVVKQTCVCLMLHTCALQEGGAITEQAPPRPVREKSYTEGQSYDTASGRVVTMTSSDTCFTVTMETDWVGRQVRGVPRPTADDLVAGAGLMTITEVKTPTSPVELRPGVCDAVRDVTGGGGAPLLLPSALPGHLKPTHAPAHLPPSMTSVPSFSEMSPELAALLRSANEQKTFRELNLMKTSEKMETVLLMSESCDQDQQLGPEPQVAVASVVGPPPQKPPPPPPGVVDDVIEDWGSNNSVEVGDEEVGYGKQDSSDESSDASEDAISVLAQAAVAEVIEVAVSQAQHSASDANQDSSDANQDSSDANQDSSDAILVSIAAEHEVSGSMEDYSPRPLSALGSEPEGEEDFPDSDELEDEGGWATGQPASPPPLPRPPPSGSASQVQASVYREEDDDDQEEVPVMRRTLTYEAPGGDSSPPTGLLLSSQTFTAETSNTTTTTHITKMLKGAMSETRIEKRIVISGDTDIDHDQALVTALSEARRQHPELSVTRVVIHKETEVSPDHVTSQVTGVVTGSSGRCMAAL